MNNRMNYLTDNQQTKKSKSLFGNSCSKNENDESRSMVREGRMQVIRQLERLGHAGALAALLTSMIEAHGY